MLNLSLPRWAHVTLTLVALSVPWVVSTALPAAGVAVPALVVNLATLVVAVVNSVKGDGAKGAS